MKETGTCAELAMRTCDVVEPEPGTLDEEDQPSCAPLSRIQTSDTAEQVIHDDNVYSAASQWVYLYN